MSQPLLGLRWWMQGPWPTKYNAVRVMVEGYGPVAVPLYDARDQKGRDLYNRLKEAMSTRNEYTNLTKTLQSNRCGICMNSF